jgi:transcriptional regulator with XRE-family HTH domain
MKPVELKNWRQRNGYTQNELSKMLGVAVMTVSRWETGSREVPPFLHLALSYLELKREESDRKIKRQNKGGK